MLSPASRHLIAASLRRALFGVGPVATARALIKHLRRADAQLHRRTTAGPTGPHPFDTEFGVRTDGFMSWRDLQTGGASDPYISGYFGVTPSIARRLIAVVEQPQDYTFIDIGCGKGRAAIIASERPFRRVVGVEIVAALAAAAQANVDIIRARYPERPAIEIVHIDAAAYDLPPGPLVLFLYQPFEHPVMRRLLARLAASLAATPRPVILLYVYPALARVLDRFAPFERRGEGSGDPTEDERPFSYDGDGGTEPFAIWATRAPRPNVAPLNPAPPVQQSLNALTF